ncbi:MAG: YkgJ family cysteine cluster protein [Polyangia bacterium]
MEDEYTRELRAALVKAISDRHELEKKLAGAEARVAQLTDILEHQGMLAAGHKRLLERVDQKAQGRTEPRYKLRVINTERAKIAAPAIDCASRWSLCQGRCCQFEFALTAEDVAQNKVRWEPSAPFVIHHDEDTFCSHFDREGGGCTVYEDRPTTCRTFTCENDSRIWIDFEKRIPQPWTPPPPRKKP